MEMTEDRALEILNPALLVDNSISWSGCSTWKVNWQSGSALVELSGKFNPDELMAIAWWMRNKGGKDRD